METFSAAMRKHIKAGAKPGAAMRATWKGVKSGKVSPPPKRKGQKTRLNKRARKTHREILTNPITGKGIRVKYVAPTNKRDARLIATAEPNHRISLSYHNLDGNDDQKYEAAARALANKLGWKGELLGGGLKDGSIVFVFNREGKMKKNPAPKISDVFYAVAYKPPNIKKHWWNGADAVTEDKKRVAIFASQGSAEKAATSFKNRMDKGHAKFIAVEPFNL